MALGGKILFTPHLAPMNRGILATCTAIARGPCDPLPRCARPMRTSPSSMCRSAPPSTKWTLGSNAVHLTARYDERTGRVLAIAALDNLVKGSRRPDDPVRQSDARPRRECRPVQSGSLAVSVTAAPGFVAAGCHAGIKRAPPRHGADRHRRRQAGHRRRRLHPEQVRRAAGGARPRRASPRAAGKAAAIIVNSGNANAGTGAAGMADAEAMSAAAAEALGIDKAHVLVCSTGIIGTPLPMDVILAAHAQARRRSCPRDGGDDAAKGILTTDHVPKEAVVEGSTFTLGGMAKGCGMIAPNMATMLAYLTTDADVARDDLQRILKDAADRTFNTLNVDGATSTNDSVILLANGRAGQAGPRRIRRRRPQRLRGPDLADGEGRRGHDQDGHAPRHRRRERRRGAHRGQEHRREQSGQMLLVRLRPLLGPPARRGRLGRGRVRHRDERGRLWRHARLARRHRDRA